MKIELKNVKYAAFASQETSCYSASLYVDGVKIGEVSNDGHGGCDMFHGDRAAYKRADEWCRANLPKWTMSYDGSEHETTLEIHCGDLLNDWHYAKDIKRGIAKRVMFRKANAAGGYQDGIFEVGYRGGRKPDAALIAEVRAQNPGALIFNEMAEADALAAWKASLA